MLTKSDLNQIGNVIDQRLKPVKKDSASLKKDVKYIKKTVDLIVKSYDETDTKLNRRVTRIENHLNLPQEN